MLYRCNIDTKILFTKYFLFNSRSGSRIAPPPGPRRPPKVYVGIVVLVGGGGAGGVVVGRRSRRCREDRPSRPHVCRREERRSIATSSSQGASPGGKPVTPPPLHPPRTSARPPPPRGSLDAGGLGLGARGGYLPRYSRKHGPLSKIYPIDKKNISVQLGLVCVDLMQQTIKKYVYSLKNIPFVSMHSDPLRVEQVVIK